MALWGNKDDYLSSGTVSVKFAGINTYYADGDLIEKSAGVAKTLADGTSASDLVYEVIGSIGAGAGTGIGLAYTTYAKETKMEFQGSLALEVNYIWKKIAETALLAFFLAILAAIYPSYRATKLQPVEAMRNV